MNESDARAEDNLGRSLQTSSEVHIHIQISVSAYSGVSLHKW